MAKQLLAEGLLCLLAQGHEPAGDQMIITQKEKELHTCKSPTRPVSAAGGPPGRISNPTQEEGKETMVFIH